MAFNRFSLFTGSTLAWRLFKRHHTHFNDMYWAHQTARVHTYSSTRSFTRADLAQALFPDAATNRRMASTLGEWADSYADFDRWTQMASIMALTGYLETYIAQTATSALESSPSLIFGGGPPVDGAAFLKKNPKYDLYSYVEPLIRGDWQARISAYSRYFGPCPFTAHLSELERLRKLRNDTGHSFGRDIESMRFAASSLVAPLPHIKIKDIQTYLGVVEAVAKSIEAHVAKPYIGQYEIIKVLHRWLPTAKTPGIAMKVLGTNFSRHVKNLTLARYGKQAAIDLIHYYNSL
jgi:hypothetical protein